MGRGRSPPTLFGSLPMFAKPVAPAPGTGDHMVARYCLYCFLNTAVDGVDEQGVGIEHNAVVGIQRDPYHHIIVNKHAIN